MPMESVKLGARVQVWQPNTSNLYGCEIGDDTKIGALVEVQKGVGVGKGCIISSHSFLCEGVTLGDRVFIGHGVVFCNEKYPQAGRSEPWELMDYQRTFVGDDAVIGSNATILSGIRIGPGAIVGAGSVVTKDVPRGATVVGNPAGQIGGGQKCSCADDLSTLDERIEAYFKRELGRIVR